jgi:sugar phosphate isomerase/epimerase
MSPTAEPRFAVSQITTFRSSFDEDLTAYRDAGADGIGIWEFKVPAGEDAEWLARLRDSGLVVTTCVPDTASILPLPMPGPTSPRERTDALCAAIGRLAAFEPAAVLVLTGHPGALDPREARRLLVEGLRRAARVAADHGIVLALEPLHRQVYADWSTIATIAGAVALMDDVGEPNVRLLVDVYNLWDTDTLLDDIGMYAGRLGPGVHVCDWREPPRNAFDRALPGEGIADLPQILGALDAAGFDGWFELEIFSDDGSFSGHELEDSLWKENPVDVVRRGKAGFMRAWEARRLPLAAG